MAGERDENLHNLDVMPAFGLEKEGDDQNRNKSKSKTTKENRSAEEEGSTKRRKFAVVDTEDLDALVEDSQAKKTKQATRFRVTAFRIRVSCRDILSPISWRMYVNVPRVTLKLEYHSLSGQDVSTISKDAK